MSAPWSEAHEQAIRENKDCYVDPETGRYVFTSAYLTKRGNCCASGCRHCPYKNLEGTKADVKE